MFELAITVEDADIDMLGHASNIAYVRWIQDAAVAHSAEVGLDLAAYQRLGAVFVVRRHEVDYLRPAFRGETLVVQTTLDDIAAAKCTRVSTLVRAEGGERLAAARTTWGYVDLIAGRPTRIPEEVRQAFGVPPRVSRVPGVPGVAGAAGEMAVRALGKARAV